MADARHRAFKFDHQFIKIYKLASVSLLTLEDDIYFRADIRSFPAHIVGIHELGYPLGYSDVLEDMQEHQNPHLSFSTMATLNIAEGPVDRLFKISMKYNFDRNMS